MALGYLDDSALTGIADAIREKDGRQGAMTVAEMPARIRAMEGGSWLPVESATYLFTMFRNATITQSVIAPGGITCPAMTLSGMFAEAKITGAVDLSGMTLTANDVALSSMFTSSTVRMVKMPTATVSNISGAFKDCMALLEVDLSRLTFSNGVDGTTMFSGAMFPFERAKLITGDGFVFASGKSPTFPNAMRDELGNDYAAGDAIPNGAHTYTLI